MVESKQIKRISGILGSSFTIAGVLAQNFKADLISALFFGGLVICVIVLFVMYYSERNRRIQLIQEKDLESYRREQAEQGKIHAEEGAAQLEAEKEQERRRRLGHQGVAAKEKMRRIEEEKRAAQLEAEKEQERRRRLGHQGALAKEKKRRIQAEEELNRLKAGKL